MGKLVPVEFELRKMRQQKHVLFYSASAFVVTFLSQVSALPCNAQNVQAIVCRCGQWARLHYVIDGPVLHYAVSVC